MKIAIAGLALFFITACANLIDSNNTKPLLFEEQLAGEHGVLANCVANNLQSDGRSFLRPFQFINRQYPDIEASEVYAYDTRYLKNATATYAPSNPDAIFVYAQTEPEIQLSAQRNNRDKAGYVFVLSLKKMGDRIALASLKGDVFIGNIAWKTLQSCLAAEFNP